MVARNQVIVQFLGDASGLQRTIGQLDNQMHGFARTASRAMQLAGAAIITASALSVKSFANFEDAMLNSAATFSLGEKITTEKMASIEEAARRVGRTSTLSATQGAEALDQLALAGFNVEQSLASLDIVSYFAEANKLDLGAATDFLTDIQTGFRLRSDDINESADALQRISDVSTRAGALGTQSNEQTAAGLAAVAGSAGALNQSLEGSAAVLSFFADNSKKGVAGAQQLDIMLRSLTSKASKNKDEFKALGINVFDASGEVRDMVDILKDVDKAFDGASGAEFVAGLGNLGITEKTNQSLFKLLGASGEISDRFDKLLDAEGSTESKREIQLRSLTAQWKIFKGVVEDVAIGVGGVIAERIRPALDSMRDWWENNGPAIEQRVEDTFTSIGKWWDSSGRGIFSDIRTGASTLYTGMSDWWDRNGNTVLGNLEEIGDIGVGAFDRLKEWWDDGNGDEVTAGINVIKDAIGGVFEDIDGSGGGLTIGNILAESFIVAEEAVTTFAEHTGAALADAGAFVAGFFSDEAAANFENTDLAKGFEKAYNYVVDWMSRTGSAVSDGFTDIKNRFVDFWWHEPWADVAVGLDLVTTTISDWFANEVELVTAGWNLVKKATTEWFGSQVQAVKDGWNLVTTAISDWFTNEVELVKAGWGKVKTTTTEWFDEQVQAVQRGWERVTTTISQWFIGEKDRVVAGWNKVKAGTVAWFSTLVADVKAGWGKVTTAISDWFVTEKTNISNGWLRVNTAVKGKFGEMRAAIVEKLTGIKTYIGDQWEAIKGKFTSINGWGMFDSIKNAFKSAINAIISKWNSISFSIDPVMVGGREVFPGFTASTPYIPPMLAKGGVTGVNDPFMAIIGDNKTQREIVTPEGLMRDVVREALNESNGGGNGSPAVHIENFTAQTDATPQQISDAIMFEFHVAGGKF